MLRFLSPAVVLGRDLVWLFDLDWGGQVYHLSDRTVSAPFGSGGADLEYVAGLEFGGSLEDAIDLFDVDASQRVASLTLHLSGIVNVPARIEDGHDLAAASGRLWLWPVGSSDRLLLVDGEIVDPSYEGEHDPVALSVRESAEDDRALLPGDDRRVVFGDPGAAGVTWDDNPTGAPLGLDGKRADLALQWYPLIVGHPGNGTAWAAPVLTAQHDRWVVAGHLSQAATVEIINTDTGEESTFDVSGGTDQLGNPITTIDPTNPTIGSGWPSADWGTTRAESFAARWSAPTVAGGVITAGGDGMPDPWDPFRLHSGLRGAGDVLRWLLQQSTIRHDAGRLAVVAEGLNTYKIDTAISATPDTRISPWAYAADQLIPLLPVSVRTGPGGLYLVRWRFDVSGADSVASLVRGHNAERTSAIEYQGRDHVANSIRVDYGHDLIEDNPTASVLVTGDEIEQGRAPYGVSTYPARLSRSRYGVRPFEVSAPVVHDRATAIQIGTWIAAARCAPSRVVSYSIPAELAALEPGDVVTLTDDEIALSDRLAHVDAIAWQASGQIGVTLRIFEGLPTLRS